MILPLRGVARLFSQAVTCYDQVSTRVNGRTQKTVEADRTIRAVIQPPGKDDVQRLPEGFLARGGLLMEVISGTVSFYDDRSYDASNPNRQTFVRFNGELYIVMGNEPFDHYNQGVKYYQLEKYISVG